MTELTVNPNFLCISSSTKTLVVKINETCEQRILILSDKSPSEKNDKTESEEVYDGGVPIVSAAFSSCGTLFACCSHKSMSLWRVGTWELVDKKNVQRSISKIIFSPKSDFIIVADKSGDVYLHYLSDFLKPGELILGHVSMLLDVLVTNDENFIITCDRDEKIRLSHFPKAYNIERYCLGHEEFVTSISILHNCERLLLSSSGDGSLRIWDYVIGKELLCHHVKYDINNSLTNVEDEIPIICKASPLEINNELTAVCSLIYKTNAVCIHFVYNVPLSIQFKQIIETDSEPYCLQTCQDNQEIWFLQLNDQRPLRVFKFHGEKFVERSDGLVKSIQTIVKDNIENLDISRLHDRLVSSLIKKKFDNEDEYYKRKRERLEAEQVKKLAKS